MQTLKQLKSGELKGIKHLKISENLVEFPNEIFSLADTLEILDLSNNQLSQLPSDFYQLHQLKIAFFSDNLFTELPDVLGKCVNLEMIGFKSNLIRVVSEKSIPVQLRWLILTNNKIEQIPVSLGSCYRLQKLALAGNLIQSLPPEMSNCLNLELIRISANQINEFPEFLLNLPKLAFFAFSGNPISEKRDIPFNLHLYDWQDISTDQVLGQGASGVIYQSKIKEIDTKVAVKIFKGQVTSDGFPEDEMNACLMAGNYPNLVTVLGKIINHPDSKEGLVMSLIPSQFKNLGNPPSFATCSRDVFNEGANFNFIQIQNIAFGIAHVMKHLHGLGISHGDLYAHNILFDSNGDHLIGDFGAATIYNKESKYAESIEKIEVRAYGYLLDDLLSHSNESTKTLVKLNQIKDQCLNELVNERPTFSDICTFLEKSETIVSV